LKTIQDRGCGYNGRLIGLVYDLSTVPLSLSRMTPNTKGWRLFSVEYPGNLATVRPIVQSYYQMVLFSMSLSDLLSSQHLQR